MIKADKTHLYFNQENEACLLSSIISDNDLMQLCITNISDDFAFWGFTQHRELYKVFKKLYEENTPINDLSIMSKAKTLNVLKNCGDVDYIMYLSSLGASSQTYDHYFKCVSDNYTRRSLRNIAEKILEETDSVLDEAIPGVSEKALSDFTQLVSNTSKLSGNESWNVEKCREYELEKIRSNETKKGYQTGFKKFDLQTGGFFPGESTIIAANTSIGKTALALNLMKRLNENKINAVMLSHEMTGEVLTDRLYSISTGINFEKIRTNQLSETDKKRISDIQIQNFHKNFEVDFTPTIETERALIKHMVRKYGAKVVFIDYLGLINKSQSQNNLESYQVMSDNSKKLTLLSKELNISIVILAQLNAKAEGNGKAELNNVAGSYDSTASADNVFFLQGVKGECKRTLNIKKCRNGQSGTMIDFVFTGENQTYSEVG